MSLNRNLFLRALVLVIIITPLFVKKTLAAWFVDLSGTLVQVYGSILGDKDESSEDEATDEDNQDNDDSPSPSSALSSSPSTKIDEQARERLKKETELRLKNLENRKEQIKTRLEIKDGALKLKQEIKNEREKIVKKTETMLSADDSLFVDQTDGQVMEIKTQGNDEIEIAKNKIKIRTDRPLSLGQNNELIVTRPDGTEHVLTVLPDQAAAKLAEQGFTNTSEAELDEDQIGRPLYRFETKTKKRLLGLFNFDFNHSASVDAQTGDLLEDLSRETGWRRFVEFLSR